VRAEGTGGGKADNDPSERTRSWSRDWPAGLPGACHPLVTRTLRALRPSSDLDQIVLSNSDDERPAQSLARSSSRLVESDFAAFSADGRHLRMGDTRELMRPWDVESRDVIHRSARNSVAVYPACTTHSPDGKGTAAGHPTVSLDEGRKSTGQ